jgi:hypothetical protein
MKKRELLLVRRKGGLIGRCSSCKRLFMPSPELRGGDLRHEAQEQQLRADFEAHKCDEDASQAAARIVREATEEH